MRVKPLTLAAAAAAFMLAVTTGCAERADFTLKTLDDRSMTLSDHHGKTVLLTFFAVG
jgi:hypothetical protein